MACKYPPVAQSSTQEIWANSSVGFMLKRLIAAVLKAFLMILDKVFLLVRKKVVPLYPYDKRTKAITLPKEVGRQLRRPCRRWQ